MILFSIKFRAKFGHHLTMASRFAEDRSLKILRTVVQPSLCWHIISQSNDTFFLHFAMGKTQLNSVGTNLNAPCVISPISEQIKMIQNQSTLPHFSLQTSIQPILERNNASESLP